MSYDLRLALHLISRKPGEFQKTLDKMDIAEKRKLLLMPLSEGVRENTLSYIVSDCPSSGNEEWRMHFLIIALDEIEKLASPAERLAVLTGFNELGQTLFHKTLAAGKEELFCTLEDRLRKWGGNDYADAFMKRFLDEPLGTIDENVSAALITIHNGILPYGSEEYKRLGALCNNNYKPATYNGLKATVDKVRPLILKWAEWAIMPTRPLENPKSPPLMEKGKLLKAFAQNADAVRKELIKTKPARPPKTGP